MRATLALTLAPAALLAGGCVHLAPFQPVEAAQSVAGDPGAATGEVAGVRLTVHAGDWDGWPSDLVETLTPVEVLVENHSGKELDLRPGAFTLLAPNGFRYGPVGPAEVRARLRPYYRSWGAAYHVGAFGWYPWPGYYRPWPRYYPYVWWGADVPAPSTADLPMPSPRGSLLDGGNASMLLFYPVPATSLAAVTLEVKLEAVGNVKLGELKLPLARGPVAHGPAK